MIHTKGMPTITVKDGEGNIIFEGLATNYSIRRDAYGGDIFEVEGRTLVKSREQKEFDALVTKCSLEEILRLYNLHTHATNMPGPPAPPSPPLMVYGLTDISVSSVAPEMECNHQWQHYEGFTKRYDFCESCGKKQNEV